MTKKRKRELKIGEDVWTRGRLIDIHGGDYIVYFCESVLLPRKITIIRFMSNDIMLCEEKDDDTRSGAS